MILKDVFHATRFPISNPISVFRIMGFSRNISHKNKKKCSEFGFQCLEMVPYMPSHQYDIKILHHKYTIFWSISTDTRQ